MVYSNVVYVVLDLLGPDGLFSNYITMYGNFLFLFTYCVFFNSSANRGIFPELFLMRLISPILYIYIYYPYAHIRQYFEEKMIGLSPCLNHISKLFKFLV